MAVDVGGVMDVSQGQEAWEVNRHDREWRMRPSEDAASCVAGDVVGGVAECGFLWLSYLSSHT